MSRVRILIIFFLDWVSKHTCWTNEIATVNLMVGTKMSGFEMKLFLRMLKTKSMMG